MSCPEEITPEHVQALAAILDEPSRHTQRCVEQLSYLASDGQAWTRTLQLRIPDVRTAQLQKSKLDRVLRRKQASTSQWYPVSLGVYARRRLPDFQVRDCNGVRLNLLTRAQHGDVLTRAALSNYLQSIQPGFTLNKTSARTQSAYDDLAQATCDLFTSAGIGAAVEPANHMVAAFESLIMRVVPTCSEAWKADREREFFAWTSAFVLATQYLCWVRAKPGDVVNLTVSYTTSDARETLERSVRWRDALLVPETLSRADARLAIYRTFTLAPLHSTFAVPGIERGASYYFTLKPPANTLVTLLDWQDGSSLDARPRKQSLRDWWGKMRRKVRGSRHPESEDEIEALQREATSRLYMQALQHDRLDSADHVVHFHADGLGGPGSDQPKTIRAYLRSVPRAQTQIAAGALLNLVFIYLVARGRIHDTSAAQWLLLTPTVLLAYIADQQRHYYAMATRGQRAVLWVYLGITIGTLVTVLFGEPQSSQRWGWLATSLAWLLVGSSLALFAFMAPLGNTYTWITERLTRRTERKDHQWKQRLAEIGGADRPTPTWKHYERIVRGYATCIVLATIALTAGGVYGLGKTDEGEVSDGELQPILAQLMEIWTEIQPRSRAKKRQGECPGSDIRCRAGGGSETQRNPHAWRREGSKVGSMVPLDGPLANPETQGVLQKLADVVTQAAARPDPVERPRVQRGRRPGWTAALVLAVLQAARKPLTAAEVTREIERRFEQQVSYETVRSTLHESRQARIGHIQRVEGARYVIHRAA